jgi:hypothetical protein
MEIGYQTTQVTHNEALGAKEPRIAGTWHVPMNGYRLYRAAQKRHFFLIFKINFSVDLNKTHISCAKFMCKNVFSSADSLYRKSFFILNIENRSFIHNSIAYLSNSKLNRTPVSWIMALIRLSVG